MKNAKTIRALCISSHLAGMLFCNSLIAAESHQPKAQAEVASKPVTASSGVKYNPSSCKRDADGMVYFAAGRTVFRVPYEKLLYIRGMGDQERAALPKRTDPSEPEGCPGNPLWGGSFRVQFDYAVSLPSEQASKKTGALTVNIVARPPGDTGRYDHANIEFEHVRLKLKGACDEEAPGFVACKYPSKKKNQAKELDLTVYQAKPELYKSPKGLPFAVSCTSLRGLNETERECSVNYNLDDQVSIFYKFYRSKISIEEVVSYDKAVQRFIEEITAKNYHWAN